MAASTVGYDDAARQGPLADLKVVELAHLVAGPMAGSLLADLGAQVVHVEDPLVGDAARRQGPAKDGTHVWWKASGRNKRSVGIDLRQEAGRILAHELVAWADVLITNMRVETLRGWGLDWESLHALHPGLVMLQVSGNGVSVRSANEPGFGKVGEARSGAVALTGPTDGPPLHSGFSHADSVTALMGAFGVCAALFDRTAPSFAGELVDIALFEPLFRLIDWQIIVADQLGFAPPRAGNQMAFAPGVLVNTYRSADGKWITVTSGTPRSVVAIARLLGEDPAGYATHEQQCERVGHLDELLSAWLAERSSAEAIDAMSRGGVTAAIVLDSMDIIEDPLYLERQDIVTVDDAELGSVRMHGVVPRLTDRPGAVWRTGASLGADTALVLTEWLGHTREEVERLRSAGVV
jgi:crotonobetainyl-CoA:carnitine CoA-transferase CaiB-like acyl-CoA transferase